MTNALSDWSYFMYGLRAQAAEEGVDEQCKISAVAALGRFGSDSIDYMLSSTPADGSTPLILSGSPTGYHVVPTTSRAGTQQPHWYSYIQAQQRLALYHRALKYARSNTLVATNFDAVYQTSGRVQGSLRLGDWKTRTLHNAMVPKARWLYSDEKRVTPGVA